MCSSSRPPRAEREINVGDEEGDEEDEQAERDVVGRGRDITQRLIDGEAEEEEQDDTEGRGR